MSIAVGLVSAIAAAAAAATVYGSQALSNDENKILPISPSPNAPPNIKDLSLNIENVEKGQNIKPITDSQVKIEPTTPEPVPVPPVLPVLPVPETPVESDPTSVETKVEIPEVPPVAQAEPEPQTAQAETQAQAEPQAEPKPEGEPTELIKGGGQIGRPMWGELSSNVALNAKNTSGITGTTPGIFSAAKEFLVPTDLQIQLKEVRNLIKEKQADINGSVEIITKYRKKYVDELVKFNELAAQHETFEKFTEYYKKKMVNIGDFKKDPLLEFLELRRKALTSNNQRRKGQQTQQNQGQRKKRGGADDDETVDTGPEEDVYDIPTQPYFPVVPNTGSIAIPNEIEDINKAISKRLQELEQEYKSDNLIDRLGEQYKTTFVKKEKTNDLMEEAKIEKDKAKLKITELRAKVEISKKELKELELKESDILKKLIGFQKASVREELPIDFNRRRDNYFKAKKLYEESSNRYRDYLASDLKRQDANTRLELYNAMNFAKQELSVAIDFLTKTQQISSYSSLEFSKFTQDIKDLFGPTITNLSFVQHVTSARKPWGGSTNFNIGDNYYNEFQLLLEKLVNPNIITLANIYYLAKTEEDIESNIDTYADFFSKAGTLFEKTFKDFEDQLINAHKSILLLQVDVDKTPGASQEQYTTLRKIAMPFLDRQVFGINNFKNLIDATYISLSNKLSNSTNKIKTLRETVNRIMKPIRLENGNGKCKQILPNETYNIFVEGKFEKIPILEILGSSKYENERQRLFNKIGFRQINDSADSENYQALYPSQKSLTLHIRAELLDYFKQVEQTPENTTFIPYDTRFEEVTLPPAANRKKRLDQLNNFFDEHFGGKDNLFKSGNYLKSIDGDLPSVESIQTIIDACEVDGNVGSGKEINDRIKIILEKLNTFGLEPSIKSPLDVFIEGEEATGRIMVGRDNAEILQSLADVRFSKDMEIFEICRTSEIPEKTVIYSFLNVMSPRFRSIPYNSMTFYQGKKRNCRDIFLELFLDELKKTTPFRKVKDFTAKTILEGLATQFNITIVLFTHEVKKQEIEPTPLVSSSVTTNTIYLYKDSDDLYFPIRLNNAQTIKRNLNTLQRFLGGNIDSESLQYVDATLQKTFSDNNTEINKKRTILAKAQAKTAVAPPVVTATPTTAPAAAPTTTTPVAPTTTTTTPAAAPTTAVAVPPVVALAPTPTTPSAVAVAPVVAVAPPTTPSAVAVAPLVAPLTEPIEPTEEGLPSIVPTNRRGTFKINKKKKPNKGGRTIRRKSLRKTIR